MGELGVAVVIEDDKDLRNLIEGILSQAGYAVHTATEGREGVAMVRDKRAKIVTVDIGLPDIDGFEVLRRIRRFSDAYVVMLTGRTEEPDLLSALDAGADDYITKPFRPRELRARITAMMRRPRQHLLDPEVTDAFSGTPPPDTPASESTLQHNGLVLDHRKRTACVGGTPLKLTRSEFDLLHQLVRASGNVLSRADLVRVVRGEYYPEDALITDADERAVQVHIGNLRRKLQDDADSPRWLQTVRGAGYRLADPVISGRST
ncbi:response regulator transcription factor [Pseudarthrobacter sulfonivorans]|uniref:response regulator transcription factor n=1 Tax=Pseudarthrobacter sulfonivorans TaxID=121292 RepID=UPI00168C097E|nr:response regulator transcription factor [Pseudarthrobacter sulfonivorans]